MWFWRNRNSKEAISIYEIYKHSSIGALPKGEQVLIGIYVTMCWKRAMQGKSTLEAVKCLR